MISYAKLKQITEDQIFDNFWQLLDYPRLDILIPSSEQKVISGNPFKGGSAHATTLKHDSEIPQVRCIYNEEEFNVLIGTEYEKHTALIIYVLAKDLPDGFKIKKHYKLRFQGENHNIKNIENIIQTIYVLTVD